MAESDRKRTVLGPMGTLRRGEHGSGPRSEFGSLRGETLRDARSGSQPLEDPKYTLRSFKGHTEGVLCVELEQGFVVSGSADNTLKIWSQATAECLITLK